MPYMRTPKTTPTDRHIWHTWSVWVLFLVLSLEDHTYVETKQFSACRHNAYNPANWESAFRTGTKKASQGENMNHGTESWNLPHGPPPLGNLKFWDLSCGRVGTIDQIEDFIT